MIDLMRAIRYPFSGQNALVKTFIGALMVMIMPFFFLTGLVLLGYQLRIARNVMDGRGGELPEWDNIAEDFVQGIVVFLGTLLYYLPSFILAGLGAAIAWDMVSSLNLDLYKLVVEHQSLTVDRASLSMMCLTFVLSLIWLLLSAPLVMAATARYADTREFSAFVNILDIADEVWEQRGAAALLTLNLFILALLTQFVSMLVSVTCLAGVYVQFVQFAAVCHLTGQWGAILQENRPVIRPIKPPAR